MASTESVEPRRRGGGIGVAGPFDPNFLTNFAYGQYSGSPPTIEELRNHFASMSGDENGNSVESD